MFKKIVSNLPFSPSLIGQLGFYLSRLRKEELTRKLGIIFVVLTLIVQSLAVFQPPESANASSQSDLVNGGIGNSLNNFLSPYDSNTKHLKDVMNYAGITRAEIAAAKFTTFQVNKKISWGFVSKFSYAQGERQHDITDSKDKKIATVYSRPLALWNGADVSVKAWVGHSEKMGWFAIMQACGNLVTDTLPKISITPPVATEPKVTIPKVTINGEQPACIFNPSLLATNVNCKACPGNETIWIDSPSCVPNLIKSKTSTNISQKSVDATTTTAKASDQIIYTLNLENTGVAPITTNIGDNLSDVLEYATIIDNGGGTLDKTTNTISWPSVTLATKAKQTRSFTVKIMSTIPATAQGTSDGTSYDCNITNTFGNSTNTKINCPTEKILEQVSAQLPTTGATENIIFIGVVMAVTTYFYARTRQMKKEIKIIRRSASSGIF